MGFWVIFLSTTPVMLRSAVADVGVGLQMQATAVRLFVCILGISGCHAYVDSAFAHEPSP